VKISWLNSGLFFACASLTSPAAADVITLDVRAFTDGRDLLIIRGNSLQWDHLDYAAVGRHSEGVIGGRNDPTIISTATNGIPVLTNFNWYPDWPEPPPAEIRYPAYSSVFSGLSPSFPSQDYGVTLDVVSARDQLSIYSLPSAGNGYALTLDFNDDPSGGPVWYEARATINTSGKSAVPEPSTWAMFVLGFFGIGCAARRTMSKRLGSAVPSEAG